MPPAPRPVPTRARLPSGRTRWPALASRSSGATCTPSSTELSAPTKVGSLPDDYGDQRSSFIFTSGDSPRKQTSTVKGLQRFGAVGLGRSACS